MMFKTLNGNTRKLSSATKYFVDWNGKSRSKAQKTLKNLLATIWFADIVFEEMPVIGSRLTLDFYNASRKIAIEVDGAQHYKYNKFMHGGSRLKFLNQLQRDEVKENFCEINGIRLVRILDSEVNDEDLIQKHDL